MQGKSLENVFIVRVSNLPKSGENRQRYKNPISLYYLSVSMGVVKNEYTPFDYMNVGFRQNWQKPKLFGKNRSDLIGTFSPIWVKTIGLVF